MATDLLGKSAFSEIKGFVLPPGRFSVVFQNERVAFHVIKGPTKQILSCLLKGAMMTWEIYSFSSREV